MFCVRKYNFTQKKEEKTDNSRVNRRKRDVKIFNGLLRLRTREKKDRTTKDDNRKRQKNYLFLNLPPTLHFFVFCPNYFRQMRGAKIFKKLILIYATFARGKICANKSERKKRSGRRQKETK